MSTQWESICSQLNDWYGFTKRYFYYQLYDNEQFILPLILPDGFEDKHSFQTKVRNYYALCQPINTWPPGDTTVWNDAIARHKRTYVKYPYYKTIIILDYTKVNESGDSTLITQMNTTRDNVIALCNDLADYGWSYRIISDTIEWTQFVGELNNFYNEI